MKSVFVTLLMFVVVLLAMRYGIFDIMSSSYAFIVSLIVLLLAFIFAFRVLGSPFTKDEKNDKEQN